MPEVLDVEGGKRQSKAHSRRGDQTVKDAQVLRETKQSILRACALQILTCRSDDGEGSE
jgi:hypothetical protein